MIPAGISATTEELLLQSLESGSRPFLTVTSNSMAPLIRQGDQIQVTFTDLQALKVGDIIVVHDSEGYLAHRYWSSSSTDGTDYLLLRGDRLKQFDPPHLASNLIGRVNARRRNGHTLELGQGIGRRLNLLLQKISMLAVPPPEHLSIMSNPEKTWATQGSDQSIRIARWPIYGALYYLASGLTLAVDAVNYRQRKSGHD